MGLQDVDVDAVLRALADGDVDHHNCWLGRAYHSFDGMAPPEAFRAVLEAEIAKVAVALSAAASAGTITLYRGLASDPDLAAIGRHWSGSRAVAQGYGPYLVTTAIPTDAIDWCGTVIRRIGWPHEVEFTLLPDAHVLIETIEHRNRVLTAAAETRVSNTNRPLSPASN